MLDQKDTEGSQGHSQATVKPEVRFKESVGIGETQIAGASLLAQLVKNLPALQETRGRACKDPLEKGMTPTPVFWPENSMNCMYTHFQIQIDKAMFITTSNEQE